MIAASSQTLATLFESGRQKKYSPGELVARGEEPLGVFYINSGFVKVYSISDEGNRYVHIIYKHGEIFPLIWALKDVRRRVFYEAAAAVSAWEMPKDKFLDYIHRNGNIAYEVLAQLAEQFNVYADRLDNLEYKAADERIIHRLLFLAARFGVHDDRKIIIEAPITHELIAESINLARETVSREIERLEKSGIINYDRQRIVITDAAKLARRFSEPVTLDLWGLS